MEASPEDSQQPTLEDWVLIESISIQRPAVLRPLRQWLNRMAITSEQQADRLCRLIPAQCPFERNIKLFGRTVLDIPPLCKFNPVYEEVVALRFRALCYLVDECGVDISKYH